MSNEAVRPVWAVLVPACGPAQRFLVRDGDDVRYLLGGTDPEVLVGGRADVFHDYEARLRAQPDNLEAVRAFARLGDPLPVVPAGPVLVVGRPHGGDWTDCPQPVCDELLG